MLQKPELSWPRRQTPWLLKPGKPGHLHLPDTVAELSFLHARAGLLVPAWLQLTLTSRGSLSEDSKLPKKLLAGEKLESQLGMSESGEGVYEKLRGACPEIRQHSRGRTPHPTPGKYVNTEEKTWAVLGGQMTRDGGAIETRRKEGYQVEEHWLPSSKQQCLTHGVLSPVSLLPAKN